MQCFAADLGAGLSAPALASPAPGAKLYEGAASWAQVYNAGFRSLCCPQLLSCGALAVAASWARVYKAGCQCLGCPGLLPFPCGALAVAASGAQVYKAEESFLEHVPLILDISNLHKVGCHAIRLGPPNSSHSQSQSQSQSLP